MLKGFRIKAAQTKVTTGHSTFLRIPAVWWRSVSCLHWTQLVMAVSERSIYKKKSNRVKEGQSRLKPGPNIWKILEQCSGSIKADAIRSYTRHRPVCWYNKMTGVLLLESCICSCDQRPGSLYMTVAWWPWQGLLFLGPEQRWGHLSVHLHSTTTMEWKERGLLFGPL